MSAKPGFLNVPRLYMQIFGIWPSDQITGDSRRSLYAMYQKFVFIFYYIFAASLTTEFVRLVLFHKSPDRITTTAGLVVTILMLCFKVVVFIRNKIPYMCLTYLDVEKDVWESNDEEVQSAYNVSFKWCGYLYTCVIYSSNLTVWSFTAYSLFRLYRVGGQGWDFERIAFMYELYFPFNKNDNIAFVATYNVYAGFLGVILNVAVQTTFYSLIIFAAMRLRILQIRLKKFHTFAKNFDNDIPRTLKKFIRDHQELIRFVDTLNKALKTVMLLEFLLNSVNVAAGLIQMITMESLMQLAFPTFYFSLYIMQVFVLGWTCNEIKFQSLAVADALMESPWHEQDETTKKLLHIMLMRAQKPLVLTIGAFTPMTTETAIMTIKAAYSYVTLMMKTSYDK